MANVKEYLPPKFEFNRTSDCIALMRDSILLRIYPRQIKFQLDRLSGVKDEKVEKEYADLKRAAKSEKKVYGIFGYIRLKTFSYLILIEEASLMGVIMQGIVYRVDKLLFIPLDPKGSLDIAPEDKKFVQMLQKIQEERAFYFSYDIDLTKNIQRTFEEIENGNLSQNRQKNVAVNSYMIMRDAYPNSVDYLPQFAFNEQLLKEFQGIEYSPFRIPCIQGYVFISAPKIKSGQKTEFYLISRKDWRRSGRRFIVRGLDHEGNAANFAETEHVFVQYLNGIRNMKVASYLQVRGSIPLLWSMKPNLKWSPPVIINQAFENSLLSAELHFKETKEVYGKQYLVNLIDKKGSQKRIGDQFTNLYKQLKDEELSYTWFDFHGECKKMKWENLSKLIDIVKEELKSYGLFQAEVQFGFDVRLELNNPKNLQITHRQTGIMRTNCMDCLDRTNVVQSVFSRQVAFTQLQNLELIPTPAGSVKRSAFEKFPEELENAFREAWSDNADRMSQLYTGTPALKTDFTRTGKRTYMGAVNDGINSVTRYYYNNFTDGYYCDCLDLFTNRLTTSSKIKSRSIFTPLKKQLLLIFIALLTVHYVVQNFIFTPLRTPGFLTNDIPQNETQELQNVFDQPLRNYTIFQYAVFVLTIFAGVLSIVSNGRDYIDEASRYQ